MEKIFDDKVALATGGSFGIGRASAVAFAKRRAKIVVTDWMEDKENETIKPRLECRMTIPFIIDRQFQKLMTFLH
jgi:NAD(P)-dependent dehydrogenase (short-subunit alcohol dehydrogenase family)